MKRILIVDDYIKNLKLLIDLLQKHDYHLHFAKNGESALAILKKTVDIDLVLLDVMMPGMNGFEVCRRIRDMETYNDIPIIFMTALDRAESRAEGFACGGNDYITKPFKEDDLFSRIQAYTSSHHNNIHPPSSKAIQSTKHIAISIRDYRRALQHCINSEGGNPIAILRRIRKMIQRLRIKNRIMSKMLTLEQHDVELQSIIHNAYVLFENVIEERNIIWKNDISSVRVFVDSKLMHEVFVIIFNNALCYTPDGGSIRVWMRELKESMTISVTDSGIGIAPATLNVIFDDDFLNVPPVKRFRSANISEPDGAKLGLSVAKGIVEAHHGMLWAESRGRDRTVLPGTTFHIMLVKA